MSDHQPAQGWDESQVADEVTERIGKVLDPCGRINGTRLSLGDLGMIDSVTAPEPGQVCVHLLLDDPVCVYMVDIHTEVRAAAKTVAGVKKVEIRHSADRLWDPDRISPEAAERMARWRRIRAERAAAAGGPDHRVFLPLAPRRLHS